MARAMLTQYGMGQTLGPVTYSRRNQPVFLPQDQAMVPPAQDFSEATAAALDKELHDMLEQRETRVEELLTQNRDLLENVAGLLLEKEVLEGDEFQALVKQSQDTKTPEVQNAPS
jgi:cell division protease FtsH